MEKNAKGRLKSFLNHLNISEGVFESNVGIAKGAVSNFGDSPRKKTLDKIKMFYPELNIAWLLTGEGDMLVATDNNTSMPSATEGDIYYTYLIPMSAMAGSLIGFDTDGVRPAECERIVSPIAGVDFAISVYGDSMSPEFPSGSRVLVKRIDPTIYIDWGNVFVLDTTNGSILKEIQPSTKEGIITCHSLNPNGKYKDFDVPMCEVRAMYKVLACVSMR